MGRRKRGKENIRKLNQIAGMSYYVTLPVSFVRNLRWKAGQRLFCFLDRSKKEIILRSLKGKGS